VQSFLPALAFATLLIAQITSVIVAARERLPAREASTREPRTSPPGIRPG
jgi:hypothetical protein